MFVNLWLKSPLTGNGPLISFQAYIYDILAVIEIEDNKDLFSSKVRLKFLSSLYCHSTGMWKIWFFF